MQQLGLDLPGILPENDRLFLVLNQDPFDDFVKRGKKYELRRYEGRFCEKTIFLGRKVELSCGYGKKHRKWGEIGKHIVIGGLEEIFEQIDFKLIEPRLNSKEEAVEDVKKLLGESPEYIAFEVNLS